MNDFKRNKHFPEKIASNLKFLNNLQPEWKRHIIIVRQTKDLHEVDYTQLYDFLKMNQEENVGNHNGLIVFPGIANHNANQNGNGNVVAARAEGNGNGNNGNQVRCYNCRGIGHLARNCTVRPRRRDFDLMADTRDLDEIKEVNANCVLVANLQQALTLEEQYTELLEPITEPHQVQQNDSNVIFTASSVEHNGGTLEQNPATVEETRALFESLYKNLVLEFKKVNTVNCKIKETNADLTIELARYKNQEMFFEINQEKYDELESYQYPFYLKQAHQKQQSLYNGKILLEKHDPPTLYDSEETLQLAQEHRLKMKQLNKEIKPVNYAKINQLLEVFESQKAKSREELYFSNASKIVNVSNSISKPISIPNEEFLDDASPRVAWKFLNDVKSTIVTLQLTSNSAPSTRDSKYENDKVIAPKMFRINPSKTTTEDKFMPINKVRASARTKLITFSQPHVITKKDVNYDLHGLSSTGVDNTAKTRRPQPRSNTKNDRVPSASKSSCIKNKEAEVKEHHRNLLLSKNQKHKSSKFNNIKLAIQNDKSEVVCVMCEQCLITAKHDVYVLNYVNDMNSRVDNQSANVLNSANHKKHMLKVKKPKKSGSKERLASPRPSKPRTCLRWSPTGRIFDFKGKLIESSDSECQSDSSKGYPNLFMLCIDDHIGGQPLAAPRTTPAALAPQALQTPIASTTTTDTTPTPTMHS
ncbi:retrovirus-related pol polyprotein from transposon TNT 1-94 [Tanacetum coccineum]